MKKCNIYKNYLTSSESLMKNDDDKINNEILEHCKTCADCSYDKRLMEKIKIILTEEVKYPEQLKSLSYEAVNNKNEENETWLNSFCYNLLKPLEILAPVCALIILVFMIQINEGNTNERECDYLLASNSNNEQIKTDEYKTDNAKSLQKISDKEVHEFLAKLEQFEKANKKSQYKDQIYDFKLVNYK